MFLWPSKPEMIYEPDSMIRTWTELGKLDKIRVQLKKNGCRAITSIEDKVTIYDRHRTTLTVSLERDWSILQQIWPKSLIDGELIGRKQGEVSNRLYLWDIPVCQGEDLTKVSYLERYEELLATFMHFAEGRHLELTHDPEWTYAQFGKVTIGVVQQYPAESWLELLKAVNYAGSTGENEGLVWKEVTHNLGWSQVKTKDIKEQKKFLLKYHKLAHA